MGLHKAYAKLLDDACSAAAQKKPTSITEGDVTVSVNKEFSVVVTLADAAKESIGTWLSACMKLSADGSVVSNPTKVGDKEITFKPKQAS